MKDALEMYKNTEDNSDEANSLRSGEWFFFNISETDIFGILERAKQDGTAFNPEHLIGSALVQITISPDGKNYVINIWNSTSVGSGTLGGPYIKRPVNSALHLSLIPM